MEEEKKEGRFTVAEALRDSAHIEKYILAPVAFAVKRDKWRVKRAELYGDGVDDLVNEMFLGAFERVRKLALKDSSLEISATFIILTGWRSYLDNRRSKYYENIPASLEACTERNRRKSEDKEQELDELLREDRTQARAEFIELVEALAEKATEGQRAGTRERNRRIISSRYIAENSSDSIAERFGMEPVAVRQVLYRFRKFITANYSEEEFTGLLYA